MKNGVVDIFKEMKTERMNHINEEQEVKTQEEYNEECGKDSDDMDENLDIKKKSTNGKAFTVEINGKKYSYYPTEESGLTAKELGEKYTAIAKHNLGRALVWLKKNATTPDSYRKQAVTEEQLDEETVLELDAEDIVKCAKEIEKKGGAEKVVVTLKSNKIDVQEKDGESNPDEPAGDDEEPEGKEPEKPEDEECGSKKKTDEEAEEPPVDEPAASVETPENSLEQPVDSTSESEQPSAEGDSSVPESAENGEEVANEEVDVAELAARLDECEGSEYMKHALEKGKYDLVKKYLYLKEED